jgi:hypothetical protein
MNNNISSWISTSTDLFNFNPADYFKEYPYYEIYNENKKYEIDEIINYYKINMLNTLNKPKKYIFCKYTINDIKGKKSEEYYIILKEIISEQEREELKKICQCDYCSRKWFDITRYFICRGCIGCLDSNHGEPSQLNINKARKNRYKL